MSANTGFREGLKLSDLEIGREFDDEPIIGRDNSSFDTLDSGQGDEIRINNYLFISDRSGTIISLHYTGYTEIFPEDEGYKDFEARLKNSTRGRAA